MCLIELEIKDTTDTAKSVSYFDIHLDIDNEDRLRTNFTTKEMISISHCEFSIYI